MLLASNAGLRTNKISFRNNFFLGFEVINVLVPLKRYSLIFINQTLLILKTNTESFFFNLILCPGLILDLLIFFKNLNFFDLKYTLGYLSSSIALFLKIKTDNVKKRKKHVKPTFLIKEHCIHLYAFLSVFLQKKHSVIKTEQLLNLFFCADIVMDLGKSACDFINNRTKCIFSVSMNVFRQMNCSIIGFFRLVITSRMYS